MARFSMKPREGHFRAMMRLFGYLRVLSKGHILVDPNYFDPSKFKDDKYSMWKEFYPDAEEELPSK